MNDASAVQLYFWLECGDTQLDHLGGAERRTIPDGRAEVAAVVDRGDLVPSRGIVVRPVDADIRLDDYVPGVQDL